jgi:hypothetical protein
MTNTSTLLPQYKEMENRPPAPIIPMHPGPRDTPPGPRRERKIRVETGPPQFYERPIFKTKKHDML